MQRLWRHRCKHGISVGNILIKRSTISNCGVNGYSSHDCKKPKTLYHDEALLMFCQYVVITYSMLVRSNFQNVWKKIFREILGAYRNLHL